MTLKEQMDADCARIEAALEEYTAFSDALHQKKVIEAMRYSLLGGGKRIRAVLALGVCRSLGGDEAHALPGACAVEMVHTYSLIHDDLPCMDDDDIRRGKPSSHKQFGEAMAVLAGDGLLTLAFEVLSSYKTLSLLGPLRAMKTINALSSAAGQYGMLGGQTIDLENEGKTLTRPVHEQMVSMKTGALIKAAVHIGCIAADATAEQTSLALDYARTIGTAFQVTDDLLDVTGDENLLGKPTGSDAKAEKNTFVTLLGVKGAKSHADQLFVQAQDCLKKLALHDTFLYEFTQMLSQRRS